MRLYGLILSVSGLLTAHAGAEADDRAPEADRPQKVMVKWGVNSDAGLNGSLVVNERNFDLPVSQPNGASAVADYYQRTGHPQAAEFYRRLAEAQAARTRTAQQTENYYQRTGRPEAVEFYRRLTSPRQPSLR